jgi:Zn-dependent protease
MLDLSIAEILQVVPAVLIGLTIHELSHAFVALRLGDDTPKALGRLTINPIKHIDPLGFILLVVAGFGWAKPVVINRAKLKKPVRDDILIALAGPFSNLIFAVVLVFLLKAVLALTRFPAKATSDAVVSVFVVFAAINVSLGLFNLLPIPPLDGSHAITSLLSLKSASGAALFFKYGSFALLGIIVLERMVNVDILPIGRAVRAIVMALLRLGVR